MTPRTPYDRLSTAGKKMVNDLCDSFENRWRHYSKDSLPSWRKVMDESLISQNDDALLLRAALCEALIEIDREARVRRGIPESKVDYQADLPIDLHFVLDRIDWTKISSSMPIAIGPYHILRMLGIGGMGQVYLAEQQKPIHRQVALKVIKTDTPSREIMTRFESERQALAIMEHEHIARMFDAGTDASGRPYFVMEWVQGVPITEYCDTHQLSPAERLRLMIQACSAVQHAHRKGIIHRDLKPSNLLVTEQEGEALVKVIDFGLAKAIHDTPAAHRISLTQQGLPLGTLAYMSPEQTKLNTLDVDTRTDVYSLGAILYELLTGSTPITKERLEQEAWDRIFACIRDEEADRPSRRLSDSGELLTEICQRRNVEPARFRRMLQGDLDWIAVKALEKDRDRRYESPTALADDLQRFLQDQAVQARPPSTYYRLRKTLRKHRTAFITGTVVFGLLVVGIIGTTAAMLEAQKQRKLADGKAKERDVARIASQKSLANETKQRRFAEAITSFVKEDFLALTSVEGQRRASAQGLNRHSSMQDLLERAAVKLNKRDDLEPLIEAELRLIVGISFSGAGEASKGVPFLERALQLRCEHLGDAHPGTLNARNSLACCLGESGQLKESLEKHQANVVLADQLSLTDQRATLFYRYNLGVALVEMGQIQSGIDLLQQTLASQKEQFGTEDSDYMQTVFGLAQALRGSGRSSESISLFEDSLTFWTNALGDKDILSMASLQGLAGARLECGQIDQAVALFEKAFVLWQDAMGAEHPSTLDAMNKLGASYRQAGRLEEAVDMLENAYRLRSKKLGDDHLDTMKSANSLAVAFQAIGQHKRAIQLLERIRKKQDEILGPEHPDTLNSDANLAISYEATNQSKRALKIHRETFETLKAGLGHNHPQTLHVMNNLAMCYRDMGETDQALEMLKQTFALRRSFLGEKHPDTLVTMGNLAATFWSDRQFDRSVPLFEELLEIQEKALGRKHPDVQLTIANLGVNYVDSGRADRGSMLLEEVYLNPAGRIDLDWTGHSLLDAYARAQKGEIFESFAKQFLDEARNDQNLPPTAVATHMIQIANGYMLLSRADEAIDLFREAYTIRKQADPNAWTTFSAQSLLGRAVAELALKDIDDARQKDLRLEAEGLLIEGVTGMRERESMMPPPSRKLIGETLDSLIELQTTLGKTEDLPRWKEWRQEYLP